MIDLLAKRHMMMGVSGGASTLLDGLVSYWKLDESSGDAIDSAGSNNGTVVGATQGTSGKIGTAYSFDGNDEINYGSDPVGLEFGAGEDFSISIWFKTSNTSFQFMLGKGGDSTISTQKGYGLAITGGGSVYGFIHDGSRQIFTALGTGYNNNNWHQYTALFDRNGNLTRYVDGVELGSEDISSVSGSLSSDKNLYVGRYENAVSGKFIGAIDDVKIWGRLLTSSEVQEDFDNGLNGIALL